MKNSACNRDLIDNILKKIRYELEETRLSLECFQADEAVLERKTVLLRTAAQVVEWELLGVRYRQEQLQLQAK
jgi:hypothetical protein